jgi:hypothetical protein
MLGGKVLVLVLVARARCRERLKTCASCVNDRTTIQSLYDPGETNSIVECGEKFHAWL